MGYLKNPKVEHALNQNCHLVANNLKSSRIMLYIYICIYIAVHITYPIKYPIANYVIVVLSVLH